MDLKQITKLMYTQNGIVMKFIPQKDYDNINIGDTFTIAEGYIGKVIKKHYYPYYKGSETAITYKIMDVLTILK